MHIGRPVFCKLLTVVKIAGRCYIVSQRIKPYIYNMFSIERDRNAPVKGSPGDTKILETIFYKVNHLITPGNRLDKIRIFLNVFKQSFLIFRHPEEVAFFFNKLDRPAAIRTFSIS
ncbi:hypothetical protein SDC9_173979 [bioreactor metagenome]|uniref:Uncharacterized protein n=1 Tax=bioreactor metagenome TaxID=1076179 RepID=A0A645GRE4_9ZZZZ